MVHVFQVGAGSGGMPVLDMLCRDARITRVTMVEPDVYEPHNVERHVFGYTGVGKAKANLARGFLLERRPDLDIRILACDLTDPNQQGVLHEVAEEADLGICAADNEKAKYHFDCLMRQHRVPWTLGEVLAGGIGGFVHCFVPEGPCYGCVASHLQRSVKVENAPRPDYAMTGGRVREATIPASMASIHAIAALHALVSLDLLTAAPTFTTLLWTLQRVPGIFDEAYRPFRYRVARAVDCLICQTRPTPALLADLDLAFEEALARLAHSSSGGQGRAAREEEK